MYRVKTILPSILVFLCVTNAAIAGCMDTDNPLWRSKDSEQTFDRLMSLMACPFDADKQESAEIDTVACNYFVAKSLDVLYGVDDFTARVNGKWLTADEIVTYVRSHPKFWTKLGNANNQQVLRDAAAGAANGQPVIATLVGTPHGHVALVLGGRLQRSSTWNLDVPNSAAFKLSNVDKAYVFCRLSAAFSDPENVEIYWREKR